MVRKNFVYIRPHVRIMAIGDERLNHSMELDECLEYTQLIVIKVRSKKNETNEKIGNGGKWLDDRNFALSVGIQFFTGSALGWGESTRL